MKARRKLIKRDVGVVVVHVRRKIFAAGNE